MSFAPGTIVDERVELIALIGEGGMGVVYKAQQLGINRTVAVKFLKNTCLPESEEYLRFVREAQVVAALQHQNIVAIYGYGIWCNSPYMILEYVKSHDLQSLLNAGEPLDLEKTLAIARQIGSALECAHRSGVVHRDIKPTNIILNEDNHLKVIDFGLAKDLRSPQVQALTEAGCAIGSVLYMSPEQCLGKGVDPRSDIYSFGCLLQQMLTGVPPFVGDHSVVLMYKQINEQPPLLTEVRPQGKYPAGLQPIISRCLAKEPARRYAHISEVMDDLAHLDKVQPYVAPVASAPSANLAWRSRISTVLALGLLAVVAIMVAALVLTGDKSNQSPPSSPALSREETSRRLRDEANQLERQAKPTSGANVARLISVKLEIGKLSGEIAQSLAKDDPLRSRRATVDSVAAYTAAATLSSENAKQAAVPAIIDQALELKNLSRADKQQLHHIRSTARCFVFLQALHAGRIEDALADYKQYRLSDPAQWRNQEDMERELCNALRQNSRFADSLPLAEHWEQIERQYAPDHLSHALALLQLAETLHALKRRDDELVCLAKADKICSAAKPADWQEMVRISATIAQRQETNSRYDLAHQAARRVLQTLGLHHKSHSVEYAQALTFAGAAKLDAKQLAAGSALCQEAALCFDQCGSPELAAWSMQRIHRSYENLGDFERAQAYARRALKFADQMPSGQEKDCVTAVTLSSLASCQMQLGDLHSASQTITRAADLLAKYPHADIPNYRATIYTSLFRIRQMEHRYADAQAVAQQLLACAQGCDVFGIADEAYREIGDALEEQGKLQEARDGWVQFVHSPENHRGTPDYQFAERQILRIDARVLAQALERQGRLQEARDSWARAVALAADNPSSKVAYDYGQKQLVLLDARLAAQRAFKPNLKK